LDDGVVCPECGTWGAKKSLFKVKCVNPNCRKYDAERAAQVQQNRVVGKSASDVFPHLKGKADPEDYRLKIRYRNFRGDEVIYSAHPGTLYQTGVHVVARLAPTGKRVTFALDRIQNRSEVETILRENPQPSGHERRVLRYHLKRGTTSALFEKLRQKYPNYVD
jgi:hypothetical protein